jgi:deoxyribose-phosphate aldolase
MRNVEQDRLEQLVRTITQEVLSRLQDAEGAGAAKQDIARLIDHTLLKPDATREQIVQLCHEARQYRFASVCVNPTHVALCAQLLAGTGVPVCTVIGFPLGATTTAVKVFEAHQAMDNGASELDMVIDIGALKSADYERVKQDVAAVALACHARDALLKVIIEAALLTQAEKETACQLAMAGGGDFVKTSTGFGPGGATVEDVTLMRRVVGPALGVKAAGGIRSFEDAQRMIEAGATRLGASAGVRIAQEAQTGAG